MNRRSGLLLCAVVGLCWSCGGGGTNTGTINGTIREVGGPAPGLNRAIKGFVRIDGPSGQQREVRSSADGTFSVGLAPGAYRLSARSPEINDGSRDCSSVTTVRVHADRRHRVEFICEIF